MATYPPLPNPDPADVEILQQVFQLWNGGNQPLAIDTLRPMAEAETPWAAALMAWLLMQQGAVGIDESVTWAIKAAQLGVPTQAIHTFNNAIGHVATAPQLADRLPELLQWALPWSGGVDLVGQGWNLVAQGQPLAAVQVMMLSTPWPLTEPGWGALVAQARERGSDIEVLAAAAQKQLADFEEAVDRARDEINSSRDGLKTSASQAQLLVSTISSDATNSLFVEAAKRNEKQSTRAWAAGLTVLGAAAIVAVLPVLLHYLDVGPDYSAFEQLGVHLASTAALATFAGVLLARARSRDRAAQRAHDLSTAMGTMITYSNQISDPTEKQRFMMTMGQVVLQAHLTTGSNQGTKDDSVSGMIALANAIRPANLSAGPS